MRARLSLRIAAFVRRAAVLCATVFCVGFAGFFVMGIVAARAQPVTIAVLNCGLIDDNAAYNDAETNRAQAARIEMVSDTVRAQLDASERYRVADNARASDLIARLGAAQDLTTCEGCARQVGRSLGVEQVGVCWVQKVSNLILNLNLRVEDVASGKTLFQRSVDIRGNTDLSWRRGAMALVGLLVNGAS
ncbi:DUF3280 domain-containing protein [Paraburkholderia sp. HD33-4]|uniref:DUF3280 domain-containing protein n=1 Tax=Paraburkholderia sp. HD33-4 TaxID=2883242 RepID=UPI001F253612|nr:DUF3280 domain-containing protein [Paraburkholderia sp. HD33-4]